MTAGLPEAVVITRTRHPLAGRELRVLGAMRRHGRLELLLVLPDGSKSLVPAAWTDAAAEGSGADGQAGQAAAAATVGRLEDLLAACALVSAFFRPGPRRPGAGCTQATDQGGLPCSLCSSVCCRTWFRRHL